MTKRRFTAKFDIPEEIIKRAANQRITLQREFVRASEAHFFTHAWCVVVRLRDGKYRQYHGFASSHEIARVRRSLDTNFLTVAPENKCEFTAIVEADVAIPEQQMEVAS